MTQMLGVLFSGSRFQLSYSLRLAFWLSLWILTFLVAGFWKEMISDHVLVRLGQAKSNISIGCIPVFAPCLRFSLLVADDAWKAFSY